MGNVDHVASQRAEVVEGLYGALTNNNLTDVVGIIVDESSSLSRATSEYSTWLPQVQDKVRPHADLPLFE